MLGHEPDPRRGPGGTGRAVSAQAASFVFGGVAFELLADADTALPLAELQRFLLPSNQAQGLPRVVAALSWDRHLVENRERVTFTEQTGPEHTELSSRHLRARLRALGPGQYVLDARVAPSLDGLTSLLLAASGAVLQREGGLNLHATAVEVDGRALLLIGPSGAGKSTACDLIDDAPCLAHDRVTLVRAAEGRFHVFALPGGKAPLRTELGAHASLPLAGLLRVRRGTERPRFERLEGAAAFFVLHEAVQTTLTDTDVHTRRFDVLDALRASVPVGALYTVLGQPLGGLVREFLRGAA